MAQANLVRYLLAGVTYLFQSFIALVPIKLFELKFSYLCQVIRGERERTEGYEDTGERSSALYYPFNVCRRYR